MTPEVFRARFAQAAAEHSYSPIKFVTFDRALLETRNVAAGEANFLADSGLPESASFFQFRTYSSEAMEERLSLLENSAALYLLGDVGAAGLVALDTTTGRIVQVRYGKDEVVFVNSSLHHLAEALCVLHERITQGDFLELLGKIDAPAVAPGAAWREIADDLQALEDYEPHRH